MNNKICINKPVGFIGIILLILALTAFIGYKLSSVSTSTSSRASHPSSNLRVAQTESPTPIRSDAGDCNNPPAWLSYSNNLNLRHRFGFNRLSDVDLAQVKNQRGFEGVYIHEFPVDNTNTMNDCFYNKTGFDNQTCLGKTIVAWQYLTNPYSNTEISLSIHEKEEESYTWNTIPYCKEVYIQIPKKVIDAGIGVRSVYR